KNHGSEHFAFSSVSTILPSRQRQALPSLVTPNLSAQRSFSRVKSSSQVPDRPSAGLPCKQRQMESFARTMPPLRPHSGYRSLNRSKQVWRPPSSASP